MSNETKTTPIQQTLRDLYPTHALIMQAANKIDQLEKLIEEMEERREWDRDYYERRISDE